MATRLLHAGFVQGFEKKSAGPRHYSDKTGFHMHAPFDFSVSNASDRSSGILLLGFFYLVILFRYLTLLSAIVSH